MPTTWVLVADGARAQIYESTGRGRGLHPVNNVTYASMARAQDRQAERSRPGRVFDSGHAATGGQGGMGRHSYEDPSEWKGQEKASFAHDLAQDLDMAAQQNKFDELVIVAPPEALGYLRESMRKHAKGKIRAEINKDLTHLDEKTLPDHLSGVLPI